MGRCNFCNLKRYKTDAKKKGNRIVLRSSNFMGGMDVFEVPKGEKLAIKYIQPCDKYPNGDKNYQKFHKSWMREIGNRCEC